ncbi:OmpA family protein [uncultured Desulfobulbus sp.]|uniref:OmpA family protein n=1 Tax=uncultured Desulfobulbus sp. TaxID=239745 RepID=UPI0029C61941|nr:OmpA family protein [uncultured Desulfobulbus sp.]
MDNEPIETNTPAEEEKPAATAPVQPEPKPPALSANWQHTTQPVFVVEDSFYRSRTPPRPVHWSIAWSDLMMTMFILFLTLFAHLRTHQEILAHGKPNKIADETIPVRSDDAKPSLIFHPISQDISLKTADNLQETAPPKQEQLGTDVLIRHQAMEEKPQAEPLTPIPELAKEKPPPKAQVPAEASPPPPETTPTPQEKKQEEVITKIYDLSKLTLANEKLERFASVELVPDKTMRIILTGDLLFASGQAELTPNAMDSLKKLSSVIKKTPYMINVIGHTDDRPVKTSRFPSNWELSLARAGRVARFLIDDTQLPATQFSVSGYSSFRPVQPNTSDENRKTNRRVEIVLSKELPQVEAASPANLQ